MKRILFTLAVMTATAITTLSAQPQQNKEISRRGQCPNNPERACVLQEKMAKELGLTEAQAKQMQEINQNFRNQRKAMAETTRANCQKAQKERMDAIVKLLDDDQIAKLLTLKEARPQKGKRSGKRGQMRGTRHHRLANGNCQNCVNQVASISESTTK